MTKNELALFEDAAPLAIVSELRKLIGFLGKKDLSNKEIATIIWVIQYASGQAVNVGLIRKEFGVSEPTTREWLTWAQTEKFLPADISIRAGTRNNFYTAESLKRQAELVDPAALVTKLFLNNKELTYAELARITNLGENKATTIAKKLEAIYGSANGNKQLSGGTQRRPNGVAEEDLRSNEIALKLPFLEDLQIKLQEIEASGYSRSKLLSHERPDLKRVTETPTSRYVLNDIAHYMNEVLELPYKSYEDVPWELLTTEHDWMGLAIICTERPSYTNTKDPSNRKPLAWTTRDLDWQALRGLAKVMSLAPFRLIDPDDFYQINAHRLKLDRTAIQGKHGTYRQPTQMMRYIRTFDLESEAGWSDLFYFMWIYPLGMRIKDPAHHRRAHLRLNVEYPYLDEAPRNKISRKATGEPWKGATPLWHVPAMIDVFQTWLSIMDRHTDMIEDPEILFYRRNANPFYVKWDEPLITPKEVGGVIGNFTRKKRKDPIWEGFNAHDGHYSLENAAKRGGMHEYMRKHLLGWKEEGIHEIYRAPLMMEEMIGQIEDIPDLLIFNDKLAAHIKRFPLTKITDRASKYRKMRRRRFCPLTDADITRHRSDKLCAQSVASTLNRYRKANINNPDGLLAAINAFRAKQMLAPFVGLPPGLLRTE